MTNINEINQIVKEIEKSTREILKSYNMSLKLHDLRYSESSFVLTLQGIKNQTQKGIDLDEQLFKEVALIHGFDGNLYNSTVNLNGRPFIVKGMGSVPNYVYLQEVGKDDLFKMHLDDFKRLIKR